MTPPEDELLQLEAPAKSPTSELQFRAAQAVTSNSVEACYSPEIYRAFAIAYESDEGIQADAMERKLKAKFGNELNLQHFRKGIKVVRTEMLKAVASTHTGYILTSEGGLQANLANAITMMGNLPIAYNAFSCRPFLTESSPWGTSGNWTDHDDVKCTEWCQRQSLNVKKDTVADAAEAVARCRMPQHHPVRDYLTAQGWDGTPRLDLWLHDYLGVPNTAYSRAVASKWMMSAVNRVMNPGCQADYTLVLEGSQGKRKSTALRTLTGDWFTDDIADIGTKDSAMQLQGKWIVEISELDAFRKAEMTTVKAWLVRREDHFRPPYGRRAEDFARQNVFAASTNKDDWGLDDTGLRRFWPVKVGDIDIPGLAKARDQLWGEALYRFAEGETTFLPETLEGEAAEEQAARQDVDAWKDDIEAWISSPARRSGSDMFNEDGFRSRPARIFAPEVMWHCLGIPKKDWNHGQKMRVSRILTLAGYLKRRETKNESDDGPQREYWTPMKG